MKYVIFTFIGILLFLACKKYSKSSNDTSQNGSIRGRLFLNDPILGSYTDFLPVKNRTVTIAYDTVTVSNNFLYSTTTDTAGYFTFNNLLSNHKYQLHYQETINGAIYTADDTVTEGDQSVVLVSGISMTLNNGIAYTFLDAQGGRVPGVNVCVFSSPVLGAQDTCAGSSFQLPPSDADGRTAKFDLMPGTYYNYINVNYPNFSVKRHDQVVVGAAGFKIDTLRLP